MAPTTVRSRSADDAASQLAAWPSRRAARVQTALVDRTPSTPGTPNTFAVDFAVDLAVDPAEARLLALYRALPPSRATHRPSPP